jgi:carbon starvation protein
MGRIVFNDRVDAALCAIFMAVVAILTVYSLAAVRRALAAQGPTAHETPFVPMAPTVL